MRLAACWLGFALACSAFAQSPQEAPPGWLDGRGAQQFRDRVVTLALIYGESSGIDPQGFKVEAKQIGAIEQGCADVDVLTTAQSQPVRRERIRACRH